MSNFHEKIEKELSKFKSIPDNLILNEEQISSLIQLGNELKSNASLESIELDPYWPKWNSPWWKALLLYEAGYQHLIPKEFLDNMIHVIDTHYLHTFPLVESDIPENCDPYRHILCFCAMGNMYRILEESGYDVKVSLPWWYEWLEKYQLPNGGYNCDEAVYTTSIKASFLSTLPMLEAMLIVYKKTRDSQIKSIMDKGAYYLLKRGLYKSSSQQMINTEWLQPSFPRYYDYDVLRGFAFIIDWASTTDSSLPEDVISDCFDQIAKSVNKDVYVVPTINKLVWEGSLFYINQEWIWNEKSTFFPALDLFINTGKASVPLTLEWYSNLGRLLKVKLRSSMT